MPNVSELAAMFGNQAPTQGEKPTFQQRQGFRQWSPSSGGTKPPLSTKPTFAPKTTSSDNFLDQKRRLVGDTMTQGNVNKASDSLGKGTNSSLPSTDVRVNSPNHEPKANGDVLRNKTNYTRHNVPSNNWGSQNVEKPSWRKDQFSKSPSSNFSSKPKNQPNNNSEAPNNFTPPQGRDSFLTRRISSTSSVGESVKSSQSDRTPSNTENDFPSGDSFTSSDTRDVTWKRKQSDENGIATRNDRPSFLHRSSTPPNDSQPGFLDRRRRPLPQAVFNESPPQKPRRPPHARLPSYPLAGGIAADKRGDSFLNRQQRDLPPVDNSASPPLPGRHPSASEFSHQPPNLPNRYSSSQDPPALPERHPAVTATSSFPDRPVPPIPGMQIGSTPLPERPPPPLPAGGPSDNPMVQRSLPSIPNDRSLPPSYNDRPPIPPPDDRRDSTFRPPMPSSTLSSLQRQPSVIKTWDDEEDNNRVYDETPDDSAPEPPPLPPMDGYRGGVLPKIPQEEASDGEIYEPIEQETNAAPSLPPSQDEKKRKDAEKKEKDMRKKFKLPLEGEIEVQATGNIKSDSKWFEKFSVRAGEQVDIIRTSNNPKGKWLVRTRKGIYGYFESVNIEMEVNAIRETMKAAQNIRRDSNEPPPLPPINSPYRPAFDPNSADGELVYDETVEEELYEEL